MLKRLGRIFRIAFVNVAVILLLFLCVEAAARLFNVWQGKTFLRPPLDSPYIMIGDNPRPTLLADGSGLFYHDDRPIARHKPANEYRIIAVGGSTTVGKYAFETGGVHYPLLLEKALNAAGGPVHYRVLNAGGVGYSTLHDLVNIQSRVLEFEPDMILLMESINDYTVGYYGAAALPDYSNKFLHPYHVAPEYQATAGLFGLLSQSRLLYKYEIPHKLSSSLKHQIHYDHDVREAGRYYLRNLSSIKAITDDNDVALVVMSQPHRLKASTKVNADAVYFSDILKRFTEDRKIPYVDLFNEFGRDDKYFIDEVHHTPDGVRRLVDVLAPRVAEVAKRPVPSAHAMNAGRASSDSSASRRAIRG